MSHHTPTLVQIDGTVEKVTYHSEVTGYTVIQLQIRGHKEPITIVGSMGLLQPGEVVSCTGEWKSHPTYGRQFVVNDLRTQLPVDLEGIKRYLGSGIIKGIGRVSAERIVDTFGLDTLNVLDNEPERLSEVGGLGAKRIALILNSWGSQSTLREVMIFLRGHGVTNSYAQKIWKCYGTSCLEQLQKDPYCLARDIRGIGFKVADSIALKMGYKVDSPIRLQAGLEYLLGELATEGHVCYPKEAFISASADHFSNISQELLEEQLEQLIASERIYTSPLVIDGQQQPFLWSPPFWHAEKGIAREINRIRYGQSPWRSIDQAKAIDWAEQALSIQLAEGQRNALFQALSHKLLIITGGPGTGKSTITKAILAICSHLTQKIELMAPTGRAAKRLAEVTGYQAKTIHSALEWSPQGGGFKRDRSNPLEAELIIVDEASMIDTFLMYNLLKAISADAKLLLIGDIDQLPSVGAGNVLKDIIHSKVVPVSTLIEIFRQAACSQIVTNAHAVNRGVMPQLNNEQAKDFFFVERDDPTAALQAVIALVVERIPQKWKLDVFNQVQVLAPMKKGPIGIDRLNQELQRALNPPERKEPFQTGMGYSFFEGDKVMQLRNDYKNEVFNGDVGLIQQIDHAEGKLMVNFDGHLVEYESDTLMNLTLAYAATVHKFQGSQCPAIIIVLHNSHFMLLYRNMLYTAITRAEKLVVVVGCRRAIALAVQNDEVKDRHTGLRQALQGSCLYL